MSDVNEIIRDETLYFMALLLRYREGVAQRYIERINTTSIPEMLAILNKELAAIPPGRNTNARRQDIANLMAKLRAVQAGYRSAFISEARAEMRALEEFTALHESTLLTSVFPTAAALTITLPDSGLLGRAIDDSFNGRKLRDWFKSIDDATLRAIEVQVEIGLTRGDSPGQILTAIRGSARKGYRDGILNTTRNNAAAVMRSVVNHVANRARQITFEQNRDIVAKVQWVSTLDHRTSDICRGLDGQTFLLDEGPRPPAHPNCRSTIIAVTKSWQELGFDLTDLPAGTRASINGQISSSLTYNEYFGRLSPSRQKQVRLSETSRVQRNTLTLDELKDLTRR